MSPIRSLGRHTAVYGAGIMLGKLASFIMLPVYTRYLTPADYGVLELLSMTIEVIGMVAGIGLASAVFKFYADARETEEKNRVVTTAAWGSVGLAALASSLGIAFAPLLSRVVIGEAGNPAYFRIFFLIYLLQSFEYVPLMLMRAQQRSRLFVAINVTKLVAMLSLNIYFVVHLRMGVMGVLTSNLITAALLATGLTAYLVRQAGIRFSLPTFRAMARFGNPMVLWSLGTFVLVFSDRFFLNHYVGTAEVGIYSLAYKFAFVVSSLAYAPFRMNWDAQRFEVARRPDAQEVYERVFLYLNLSVGTVALGIALFVRDFLGVMSDPAFLPAHQVVPVLLAAQIAFIWVNFCNLGLFLKSKTPVMGAIAVAGVLVTLGLNFLLIPRFGIWGAAWATLAAYVLRFAAIHHASQRHYPIRYGWANVARLYAVYGAAVALRLAVDPESVAASVAWSAVLMLAAVGAAWVAVVGKRERAFVRGLLVRARILRVAPA